MISPQHEDFFGHGYFNGQDEDKDFDCKASPINIVSQKQVFCPVRGTANLIFQQLYKVVVLSMYIADDCDGVVDSQ